LERYNFHPARTLYEKPEAREKNVKEKKEDEKY